MVDKPAQQQTNNEHALAAVLAHPIKFVIVATTLAVVLFALLLGAGWAVARFVIAQRVEISGIKFQAATDQIIVPASAGWIPINPVHPFPPNTHLKLTVSGRVHLAMHHEVNLANWQYAMRLMEPPPMPTTCGAGRDYLQSIGHWKLRWTDFAEYAPVKQENDCLLNPRGQVGQLVYAVVRNRPIPNYVGVRKIRSSDDIHFGVLSPSDPIVRTQDYGGYVLLAVNDTLSTSDCAKPLYESAKRLRALIDNVDKLCGNSSGKFGNEYDLSPESLATRDYDDNTGEFIIQISQDE